MVLNFSCQNTRKTGVPLQVECPHKWSVLSEVQSFACATNIVKPGECETFPLTIYKDATVML